ncbi:ral guanine nucleotide dissociation stimulator-like [Mustela erminea]|uniref:ral guanine nucleotide dissociation stimulator-like n=1 Tax=Mustela erminea TaxID=36723 RepID=UPI00138692FD|nr:ral guanine nucleotide dissociation stimulator-like [Mustela erminea]
MVEEVNEEIACSPSSKDKKPHTANRVWRWLRGKNGSTRKRTRTSLLMAERADKLEAAIDNLVPAILRQDLYCVHTFLDTYYTFASTEEVLDQLCARFGCYYSTYEEVKRSQEQRDM